MKEKGENYYRTKEKLKHWKMLRSGKPTRDASGKIIKHAVFQNPDAPLGRIQNTRSWFTSTRVSDQRELEEFRKDLENTASNTYKVILQRGKVPMSLLQEEKAKKPRAIISYEHTFGKKATRKRVALPDVSVEGLAKRAKLAESQATEKTHNVQKEGLPQHERINVREKKPEELADNKETAYLKGQSRRLWSELYKVLDSSDVVVHVIDARDPLGTECQNVRKYIEEKKHKHLIYVMNKVDLVPTKITAKWLAYFSSSTPTLAYHASSLDRNYGKQSLTNLLRQFARLHPEKKQISVGFVGYPNVGKSSVINTLRSKVVCTVAPIPGETKVWQYISLMKRIYMIDSPGVVPPMEQTKTQVVLKGAVRIESLDTPEDHIPEVLAKAKRDHVINMYGVDPEEGADIFLEALAKKTGRLLKGGIPDISTTAKIVLHDWLRGRIPYYTEPPQ